MNVIFYCCAESRVMPGTVHQNTCQPQHHESIVASSHNTSVPPANSMRVMSKHVSFNVRSGEVYGSYWRVSPIDDQNVFNFSIPPEHEMAITGRLRVLANDFKV